MKPHGSENFEIVIDIFVIIEIVLHTFKVGTVVCVILILTKFHQSKFIETPKDNLTPVLSPVCHDGLTLTTVPTLKVCRTISITTKTSMTILKFSQPFGFINGCVGYHDVLYKICSQHL